MGRDGVDEFGMLVAQRGHVERRSGLDVLATIGIVDVDPLASLDKTGLAGGVFGDALKTQNQRQTLVLFEHPNGGANGE